MKHCLLFLAFITNLSLLFSQATIVKEIPALVDFFTTDHLGNIYTLEKNNIIKYDKNGEKLYFFSTNKYGNVTSLDASNPYKILVFFNEFSTLIFLDNTLSLNGEPINIQQKGLEMTTLAATSYQNGIWLYEALEYRLIRFDENLNIKVNTPNLAQITNIEINPTFIQEYNNFLFVCNPSTGILVFDIFGAYIKSIPIKDVHKLQPIENEILYIKDHQFHRYNLKTNDFIFEPLMQEFKDCRIEKQRKYFLSTEAIHIYKTNNKP
jgi:hypothetical protein